MVRKNLQVAEKETVKYLHTSILLFTSFWPDSKIQHDTIIIMNPKLSLLQITKCLFQTEQWYDDP